MTTPSPELGRTLQAGSIRTNLHDRGQGSPVLLIHGSGPGVSAWANWRRNLDALATEHRVLAPDMVGFGFTERPDGAVYDKALWLQHLVDVMDAAGVERADVIGNSFGGAMALALAVAHPERVRKLVLMGSVGLTFPLTEGLDKVWGYEPSIAAMRELLDLFAFDRSIVTDELAELRYNASIQPGFQESYGAMFPAPRQEGIQRLASSEDDVKALPHETLVVHGREDRVIPLEVSERLFALIPRAELHVFKRCGHWTQIEHAERFNQLVLGFLGSGREGLHPQPR